MSGTNTAVNTYSNPYAQYVDNLTEAEVFRRRVFAANYVKTVNPKSAAKFAGFSSPSRQGPKLLEEPFVQELISEVLAELNYNSIISMNEVLMLLKAEAVNYAANNQNARVNALSQLAKIITTLSAIQANGAPNTGVMLIPVYESTSSWESVAAGVQQQLKENVRE